MSLCVEDVRSSGIDLLAMDDPTLQEFIRTYRSYFHGMLNVPYDDAELVDLIRGVGSPA